MPFLLIEFTDYDFTKKKYRTSIKIISKETSRDGSRVKKSNSIC